MKDKNNTKVVLSKWVEVEGQPKQLFEEIDHPCKDTCSGWVMGYNKGVKVTREEMIDHKRSAIILAEQGDKLMWHNKIMKEALIVSMQEHKQMQESGDAGFWDLSQDLGYNVCKDALEKIRKLD